MGRLQSLRPDSLPAARAPSARLLVAATARREELDGDHPLAGLATGLQALGRFTEIELDRLGREETALLAKRITGAPLDPAELERLYERQRGQRSLWSRRCSPMHRRLRQRCRR